jgi:hypothetical protein
VLFAFLAILQSAMPEVLAPLDLSEFNFFTFTWRCTSQLTQ